MLLLLAGPGCRRYDTLGDVCEDVAEATCARQNECSAYPYPECEEDIFRQCCEESTYYSPGSATSVCHANAHASDEVVEQCLEEAASVECESASFGVYLDSCRKAFWPITQPFVCGDIAVAFCDRWQACFGGDADDHYWCVFDLNGACCGESSDCGITVAPKTTRWELLQCADALATLSCEHLPINDVHLGQIVRECEMPAACQGLAGEQAWWGGYCGPWDEPAVASSF